MKKVLAAVLVIACGLTGYSFYADAYDPVREKGIDRSMQAVEREANQKAAQVAENQETAKKVSKSADSVAKANAELVEWNKLSREQKLKLIEDKRAERRKKTDASWQRKSADKKLAEYEKRLKKRAMSREEKAKIEQAKLTDKCSGMDKEDKEEE